VCLEAGFAENDFVNATKNTKNKDTTKDFSLFLKDQDQDQDLSVKDQDKDKDLSSKDQDQDNNSDTLTRSSDSELQQYWVTW